MPARSRTELIASWEYGSSYAARTAAARLRLGAEPYWTLISQDERDAAAKSGAAMPDGSYPITTCDGDNSVDTAISAVGRGGADHDSIRAHIMKRAESLGCAGKIPDDWNPDGSLKASALASPPTGSAQAPDSAAAPDAATDDAPDDDAMAPGDDAVDTAVKKVQAAIDELKQAQSADPDDTTDPNDKTIDEDIAALEAALAQLITDQAQDESEDADVTSPTDGASTPPPVKPLAVAGDEPAVPGGSKPMTDEDGNVDGTLKCGIQGCGHLASMHSNTPQGENTGACESPDCSCPGMQIGSDPTNTPTAGDGSKVAPEGDPATQIDDQTSHAGRAALADVGVEPPGPPAAPPVPSQEGAAAAPAPEQNLPPDVPGGDNMGPAFTIPVGVICGQDIPDGRGSIARDALDWRVPPMPLMGMNTSTHDPGGFDLNDPAVLCGRIDMLSYADGESGTQIVMANGFYLANEDGQKFADLNEQMGRLGVSADIAVSAQEITASLDENGFPTEEGALVTRGTIMGFTIVPFPAFQGCYIVLGDGADGGPAPIPQATDDVMPTPDAVTAGGQLLHFMAYEECEPCAQAFDLLVASGGPERPPGAWFEDPEFKVGDDRLVLMVNGRYAAPMRVSLDGEISGHIAPWGVCHTGSSGKCILAPRSKTGYAHFKRGYVVTAEGDEVATGVLTAEVGHASQRLGTKAAVAMAHYDNTALQCADVAIGEDEFGVWVHGAVRPDATEAQLRMLRASSPSGDWRELGGHLELVAALCVNQPGFPVAVLAASGALESLTAAGAGVMFALAQPVIEGTDAVLDGKNLDGDWVLRQAMAPWLVLAAKDARNRIATLGAQDARDRIAALALS